MAKVKSVKQLPSGWVVEEATEEKGEWTVKSVWGTRLYAKTRFWLIEFDGYPRLQWVAEKYCGCDDAIADFKTYMGWDEPPTEVNVELVHPDLMKAKKKATANAIKKNEGESSTSSGPKRAAAVKQPDNKKQKISAPAKSQRATRSATAAATKTK